MPKSKYTKEAFAIIEATKNPNVLLRIIAQNNPAAIVTASKKYIQAPSLQETLEERMLRYASQYSVISCIRIYHNLGKCSLCEARDYVHALRDKYGCSFTERQFSSNIEDLK